MERQELSELGSPPPTSLEKLLLASLPTQAGARSRIQLPGREQRQCKRFPGNSQEADGVQSSQSPLQCLRLCSAVVSPLRAQEKPDTSHYKTQLNRTTQQLMFNPVPFATDADYLGDV